MSDGPSSSIESSILRERSTRRVLSIQSHVVHGYAGNKAAVFPLQINGFHVDFVNSVHFSNHTGYEHIRGERLDSEQLNSIYEGLSLNGLTSTYSHLLTGYCGNPGFLYRIADIVRDLKEKNPNLLYVCDPVLGDNGEYYTPRELLPIYRESIVPLADVLTPNCFELGELSGLKIETEKECIAAIDAIHDMGVSRVVVTSGIPCEEGESMLIAIASTRNKDGTSTRHRFSFPKQQGCFVGTGDMFAALLIVWLDECNGDLACAVGRVIGTIQDVITVTDKYAKVLVSMSGGKLFDYNRDVTIVGGSICQFSLYACDVTFAGLPLFVDTGLEIPLPPSCSLPELRIIEARRYLLQPSHIVPSTVLGD